MLKPDRDPVSAQTGWGGRGTNTDLIPQSPGVLDFRGPTAGHVGSWLASLPGLQTATFPSSRVLEGLSSGIFLFL